MCDQQSQSRLFERMHRKNPIAYLNLLEVSIGIIIGSVAVLLWRPYVVAGALFTERLFVIHPPIFHAHSPNFGCPQSISSQGAVQAKLTAQLTRICNDDNIAIMPTSHFLHCNISFISTYQYQSLIFLRSILRQSINLSNHDDLPR